MYGSTSQPIEGGFAITPSDSVDLAHVPRAIYVGNAGALKVTLKDGSTLTLATVNAGVMYPIRAARVWSSVTTATGLIAMY